MDTNNTLYIADYNNHRIVKWVQGAILGTTVAGQTGVAGSWAYQLYYPTYVIMDQFGFIYIMDSSNLRVQKWWPGANYGTTVVAASSMSGPRGLRFDPFGNMVIADVGMSRVLSFAVVCREYSLDFWLISIASLSLLVQHPMPQQQ